MPKLSSGEKTAVRSAVLLKLAEMDEIAGQEQLADYVMIMLDNKKRGSDLASELELFLGDSSPTFVKWLERELPSILASVKSSKASTSSSPPPSTTVPSTTSSTTEQSSTSKPVVEGSSRDRTTVGSKRKAEEQSSSHSNADSSKSADKVGLSARPRPPLDTASATPPPAKRPALGSQGRSGSDSSSTPSGSSRYDSTPSQRLKTSAVNVTPTASAPAVKRTSSIAERLGRPLPPRDGGKPEKKTVTGGVQKNRSSALDRLGSQGARAARAAMASKVGGGASAIDTSVPMPVRHGDRLKPAPDRLKPAPAAASAVTPSTISTSSTGASKVQGAESVAGSGSDESKVPCTYWPNCNRGDSCMYYHDPALATEGGEGSQAKYGGAKKSYGSKVDCRFGNSCTNYYCTFQHPPVACRYGSTCAFKAQGCKYSHAKPCRFGASCFTPGCTFAHPSSRQSGSGGPGALSRRFSDVGVLGVDSEAGEEEIETVEGITPSAAEIEAASIAPSETGVEAG